MVVQQKHTVQSEVFQGVDAPNTRITSLVLWDWVGLCCGDNQMKHWH